MKGFASILLAAGSAAALVGMASAQPMGTGPRAVLFDQPNFQGRSITIVEGAPDLGSWGFAARAQSARFEGDWTVCDAPDLDGRCATAKGDVANLAQIGLARIVSLGEGGADDAQADGREAAMTETVASAPAQAAPPAPPPQDERVPGARIRSADAAPPAAAPAPPAGPASPPAAQVAAAAPPPAPAAPPTPVGQPQQQYAYAGPPPGAPVVVATPGGVAQGDAGRSAVFFARPTRGGAEVAIDVQGLANQFCRDQGLGPAVYFDTDGRVLRDVLCRRS